MEMQKQNIIGSTEVSREAFFFKKNSFLCELLPTSIKGLEGKAPKGLALVATY